MGLPKMMGRCFRGMLFHDICGRRPLQCQVFLVMHCMFPEKRCYLLEWLFKWLEVKKHAEFLSGEGGKSSALPNQAVAAERDGGPWTKSLQGQRWWRTSVSCGGSPAGKTWHVTLLHCLFGFCAGTLLTIFIRSFCTSNFIFLK